MARAAGGRVLSPRHSRPGHEPLRHRQGGLRGAAPAHRQPAPSDRSHGGRAALRRPPRLPGPRPGGLLRPAQGAHRLQGLLRLPRRGGERPLTAAAALRHRQPAQPALRRGRRPALQRGPDHRLRPAAPGAGASPRRRDGLHRDGVGRRRPGPQAEAAGGGRGVEHHAAPRRRGLHGVDGEAGAQAPAGTPVHTQDVQDLLSEDSSRAITGHSGRALLQNAAFKLLLQQDAAAIGTVGDAFDLPEDLQRWLLSCPRETACSCRRGTASPSASRPPRRRRQ